MGTLAVFGAGPGLGLSIAHRFGREGHRVALVSRTAERHEGYLASLAAQGIEAASFVADVRDPGRLAAAVDAITERFDQPEIVYYGPAALEPDRMPAGIEKSDSESVRAAMSWVYAAVDLVGAVLPGMLERGDGGLLFAGGLSSVLPMPALGSLALSSAALRNYAVTLHAALADRGVYAGTLTIGGLIERGDIHRFMSARPTAGLPVLDPDALADAAWDLYARRDRAEAVFNVLTTQP
ncbi:SDR family NAD(P)-dependent oxidoreductase [Hamadaea tsunoensis]|uniref:SDR family NAD(P)-dependent oxidoreductase n=1 Tax=Hamadaea tsunoensis TaxID=53368 RepID=UPI0004119FC1|nr:SDR family NAD(P)-dependent oxidoreductase [Hamadaea tsunoensis]